MTPMKSSLQFRRAEASAAIARALRAVECQELTRIASSNEQNERDKFYYLLDVFATRIFDGVTEAASMMKREFIFSTIPGFDANCSKVFGGAGLGFFDQQMLQDWLKARDLQHVFCATDLGVKW